MTIEARISLPQEFTQICDFMEVSPDAFLSKFVQNILSYKEIEDRDDAEIAYAIRYFLIYSAGRNRVCERQLQVRDDFISKTNEELRGYLVDLEENNGVALEGELRTFIADWKDKWRKVNDIFFDENKT